MVATYIFSSVLLLAVPWINMGAELEIQRLCPMTMGGWSAPCQTECSSDYDCSGNKKCCRRSTCATYCADPIIVDANGVVSKTQTNSGTSQNSLHQNINKTENIQKSVSGETINSKLEHDSNVNVSPSLVIDEKKKPNNQVQNIQLSTNECYTECKTSSDCETGFVCMELGCHHVCKSSISDRFSLHRNLIKHNLDSSRTIQRPTFRHSENRARLGGHIHERGCRIQCNKDGDCSDGYCVSVNCHQFCVRNLPHQFVKK